MENLDRKGVRLLLLHEYRLNRKAKEAYENINQSMGEGMLSYNTTTLWFQKFKSGDYDLNDKPHPGAEPKVNNALLLKRIEDDPCLSSYELGEEFSVSHTTILSHLHDIGKRWKWGRWIPHQLDGSQLQDRVKTCSFLLDYKRNKAWLDNLVTADEKYVLYVNFTRKRQWLSANQVGLSTPKPDRFSQKVLISVWWNVRGIVHWELLESQETVSANKYCEQLDEVQKALKGKQDRVYYLHDNARPHVAKIVYQKLKDFGWTVLPHPAYSPDIAPSDYHLFRSLQSHLNDLAFHDRNDLRAWLSKFFASKPPEFYRKGIMSLPDRWQQVVDNNGIYVD